ncbi:MAG: FGGY-family carbohydrate kinase [Mobilitalea sp.]
MNNIYTLSADFGTSSVKIAIIDENIQLLKTAKRDYKYIVNNTDEIEIDMIELENAFFASLSDVNEYLPQVGAVSFDAFAPSFVMMDELGRAIYPIVTHLDRRSRLYTKKIIEIFGKDNFRDITGTLPYAGGVTITTLLWFKEHRPEIFEKIYHIGHLTTYLYKRMTGKWAIDQVNASITGLYETVTGKGWSKNICEAFSIPLEILPPIIEVGSTYDSLKPEMAEKMGLKQGIPVIMGTQDVASALIGAKVNQNGQVLCISGSSEMISILTNNPITNDKYYLRASGTKGLWQIFSITTGGFTLEWFRNEFYKEMSEEEFFNEHLSNLLSDRFDPRGVRFLPYMTGDRQSLRKKKGSFNGLTLNTSRDDMLCALLEGIQQQSKCTLDRCKDVISANDTIKVTGNMAENDAYIRIKRKVFNYIDIEVIDNCSLKGNAIMVQSVLKR